MKHLTLALLTLSLLAAAFTLCTGSEQCLNGHSEYSGRECK